MLPTLRMAGSGTEVAVLQAQLNLAYPYKIALALDGRFGPLTRARVIEFQREKGLVPDAVVGPLTWGELRKVPWTYSGGYEYCGNADKANHDGGALISATFRTPAFVTSVLSSAAPVTASGGAVITPLVGSPHEAVARGVYGASLFYDRIFLSSALGASGRAFTIAVPILPLVVRSLPLGGLIQILNVGTSPARTRLIHELGHAWQSQHFPLNGEAYVGNALACQAAAIAFNKAAAEFDPGVQTKPLFPTEFPASPYAYRRGNAFSDYAGEQIAKQIEKAEAPIVSHIAGVLAGADDSDNRKSLDITNIRFEDKRASSVFS
jgi:peptidoglycan hydrolase-like protein with peptidoglycan-binding domain